MSDRDRRVAMVVALGAGIAAVGAYLPLLVPSDQWWGYSPGSATAGLVYSLLWLPVMAFTYRRDATNQMWRVILVYLAASATANLATVRLDLAWTIESLFHPWAAVLLAHLCLAFPTGRIRHRVDRAVLGVAYLIIGPIQLAGLLVWDPTAAICRPDDWCPRNLLLIARDDTLFEVFRSAALLAPLIVLVVCVELARHWRAASRAGRRAIAPIALGAPIAFVILGLWFFGPAIGRQDIQDFLRANTIIDLAWFITPCLFLLGAGWTRLGRGAVADLAIAIGRGVPLGGLETAIGRALRDPTLRLAFAEPDGHGLVGPDGRPFQPGDGRSTVRLEREDRLLAVIDYDPAVDREDPGLVTAAANVARLALENERLSAQVRAQLAEVRASRQRIVHAADTERRRVERDLHDGAQQRLVALSMRLELARGIASGTGDLIDETTAELSRAIAEVRELARGLHPPILVEAGLRAAVESLVERTPIPVTVDIPEARYPEEVESTAYQVIAQVLGEVARRPGSPAARVLVREDDGVLHLRIEEGGDGTAPQPDPGALVRGLLDRVAAIGGSLTVDRAAPGLSVDAVVPI